MVMVARAGKIVRLRQKLVDAADTVKGLFGVKKEQDSAVQRLERLQVRAGPASCHISSHMLGTTYTSVTCLVADALWHITRITQDSSSDMPARFIYRQSWMALHPEIWRPRRRAWSRRARCSATRTRPSSWWSPSPP